MTIRPAAPADAEAVCAIYNAGIAGRQATFETSPRTADDVRSWSPSIPAGASSAGRA